MTKGQLASRYIEGEHGNNLLVERRAGNESRWVVFVPPFAEEMNKTRRQVAVTAQELATVGLSSVYFDLYGTGDSAGNFSDATWSTWVKNTIAVFKDLERHGREVEAVVATRLGCALVAQALREAGVAVPKTVFWQPVESGYRHMTRFLRVAVAASLMRRGPRVSVDELREQIAQGRTHEVAGYQLAASLVQEIDKVSLSSLVGRQLGRIHVLNVSRSVGNGESADETRIDDLAEEWDVGAIVLRVPGAPFWASAELLVNRELADITVSLLAPS